jgi:O-antigen/teichoic acid export membrane protein
MNVFVVAMLFPQWKSFRFKMDIALWKTVFKYASPMIIIGLAGMINEVVDRIMLAKLLPFDTETNKVMVGIYGANYKLAIFITLFIQAFKMAAEPFFFKQAADKNAPALYAKVMQWFVWTMCIAFLITMLFIDIWQYLLGGEIYRKGLHIVPILLLANIFLGIYYNLSVWYKITDKMIAGIWITLVGALITIIGNLILIPQQGIIGAARVTLICYLSMVAMSYYMGQKHFPVPYPIKKIGFYLLVMIVLTILHQLFSVFVNLGSWNLLTRLALGGIGLLLFIIITIRQEKEMLQKIPYLNKFFK